MKHKEESIWKAYGKKACGKTDLKCLSIKKYSKVFLIASGKLSKYSKLQHFLEKAICHFAATEDW